MTPIAPVPGSTVDDLVDRPPPALRPPSTTGLWLAPGEPVEHGPRDLADLCRSGSPSRPRWRALRYRLPAVPSRDRVRIWRALTDARAVRLEQGVWALGEGIDGVDRWDRVVRLVGMAGGVGEELATPSTAPPELVGSDDVAARAELLEAACASRWRYFLDEVDGTHRALHARLLGVAAAHQRLVDLRDRYVQLVAGDLVHAVEGDAAGRALAELHRVVLDRGGAPAAPPVGAHAGPKVVLLAAWVLEDGTTRAVAAASPRLEPGWDAGFADFERRTYLPDPWRPAVDHGGFHWHTAPNRLRSDLLALQRRLDTYRAAT